MDANMLLNRIESRLSHIFREANQCASHLARMGAEQIAEQIESLVLTQAPLSLTVFLI
ncbi:hypothetical protein RHGRI_028433 [Rhododendron griersonianum]|uniref:RNase H type-1 domain-containing protein n=1 Tax=Rhododendron griersonianum TaxID=479676 RepID=A0AAV6IGI6_9ERIC|nr:hypothetical protein RHGRI_028433 [Rhododendron griersonianum]